MSNNLLSIRHVTARYLNNILLKQLSFNVNKGENWALIGESGSGKSALLQTIAGRFNITGGEIRYYFYEDFLTANPDIDANLTHQKMMAIVEPTHHFRNLS